MAFPHGVPDKSSHDEFRPLVQRGWPVCMCVCVYVCMCVYMRDEVGTLSSELGPFHLISVPSALCPISTIPQQLNPTLRLGFAPPFRGFAPRPRGQGASSSSSSISAPRHGAYIERPQREIPPCKRKPGSLAPPTYQLHCRWVITPTSKSHAKSP